MSYTMKLPEKIELANKMLLWLKERGLSEGKSPALDVINPFAEYAGCEVYNAYKAWELLYETGRRNKAQGGHNWKLTSFAAIVFIEEEPFEHRLKKLEKEVELLKRVLKVLAKISEKLE